MLDLTNIGPTGQFLLSTSREFAIYVCSTRAIPSVHDGLKHGQRIALWLLRHRADKIKTYALAGLLGFEKLYLHGEKSATDTIGLLAAPYKNNVAMIEGLGQFGSRVAPVEGIGAPRYTEVRRAKAADAILYHDLDLVPLKDNYDGSNQEPVHFLPLIPLVLLNGISGVAVGWSTDILPRTLRSLVEATKSALLGQDLGELPPAFTRYDIGIRPLATNQWEFSGKATIVDTSTIRITELPPGMSIESFRKRLIAMEETEVIASFMDRSTESIDITVKMKRGSIKDWTAQTAIDFFKLKEKSTERIVVIDWNLTSIRTYATPQDLIRDFAAWRLGWYTKRFEKRRRDSLYELTYWRALSVLFSGGFTKRLGSFDDRAAVERAVAETLAKKAKGLTLDGKQMDRIVGLPTYRWTMEFAAEVEGRVASLTAEIADHEQTLASPQRLLQVYLAELDTLKGMKL